MSKPIKFSLGAGKPASSGGGLYSGINFGGTEDEPGAAESTNNAPSDQVGKDAPEASEKDKDKDKDKSNWSAALAFAPTARKPRRPQTAAPRPAASLTSATLASTSSEPVASRSQEASADSQVPVETSALPPPFDPPLLTLPEDENRQQRAPSQKPPPVEIDDDDINGFKRTEMGKKSAVKDDRRGKKGRKQRRAVSPSDLTATFMAAYDPARPTDYNEWKTFLRHQRDERIRQRDAEMRQKYGSESDSAYSEDDASDADDRYERQRRWRNDRFFAPPTSYDESPSQNDVQIENSEPVEIDKQETGEDAYQRRLAMSMQKPSNAPQSLAVPQENPNDDASSISPQPDEPTPSSHSPAPQQPSAPPFDASEAEAKAREVAERIGKLTGNVPGAQAKADDPSKEQNDQEHQPNPHAFAENLMARYGWKEGQGLGANETGMITPLSVEVAEPEQKGKKKKGQDKQQQQKGPQPKTTTGAFGTQAKGRGNIVSERGAEAKKAERERYGEPSSVVVLTNMVGMEDVDDEDLPDEIAGEARKHGVCFVRPVLQTGPEPMPESEAIRIFLKFEGLVGAWNAVKEFDGRFFGGRVVRARFFPEKLFNSSKYDASLD